MLKLDLRDLTPEHFAEAENSGTRCNYVGPCIIGTLMPSEMRERADEYGPLRYLLKSKFASFPPEQAADAAELQSAFDRRNSESGAKRYAETKARIMEKYVGH